MDTLLVMFFAVVFLIWFFIVLPGQMAAKRNRSVIGWILLSLIFSPFIAIIGLLVLGTPYRPMED
jgi:hypothetical protein